MINPTLHPLYLDALRGDLPANTRAAVRALIDRRNTAPDEEIDNIDQEIVATLYRYAVRPIEVARRVLRARREAWRAASRETVIRILSELRALGYPIWPDPYHWADRIAEGEYVALSPESAEPIQIVDPSATDWRAEMVIAPAEPTRIYGSLRRQARRVLVVQRGLLTAQQVRRAAKRVAGILRAGGLEIDMQRVSCLVLRLAEQLDDAPLYRPVRDFVWRHLHTAQPQKVRRARQIAYDLVVWCALLCALWDVLDSEED